MKKGVVILLHIGYWVTYLLLIFFITFVLTAAATRNHNSIQVLRTFFSPFGFTTIFSAAAGFYVFYSILFDRLLRRKKIIQLFVFGILAALACGVVAEVFLQLIFPVKIFTSGNLVNILAIAVIIGMLSLINGIIALVMRGFITWYGDIKLKEELNRKNFEVELALVKSQINPHFLFNTINNIDVLIEMDAAKASLYLNKLSAIMRFMLYETKGEQIPLATELAYIEKYIDLQRLRTANPDFVQYNVSGDAGNMMIEPMLFIPFIENAFKHAENKKDGPAIHIQFTIDDKGISFTCSNAYSLQTGIKHEHSGLGKGLIEKRLALLYPGRHTLAITDEHKTYNVTLSLHNDGED